MARTQTQSTEEFMRVLSQGHAVSGYEAGLVKLVEEKFSPLANRVYNDKFCKLPERPVLWAWA